MSAAAFGKGAAPGSTLAAGWARMAAQPGGENMWRGIARGLAVAALIAACAAPSQAADRLRVGKASPTAIPMVPVEVGAQLGIFEKHGLAVEIADFAGGAKLHQAMAAGSVDIGIGAGPELALIAKGSPELAICNAVGPPLFIGIAVPKESPARSAADLKGARIGVTTINSLTYWLALELARQRGWGPGGVTPVAIGGEAASMIAAFRTKTIDAGIVPTSLAFQMEEQGVGRLLFPVADYAGNLSAATIFASRRLIETNPDAIRRFLAGWFDAVALMRRDKAETVRIASAMTGFSPAVQGKEYDLTIKMFSTDGKFDADSLATLKRSFADLKLLDSPPDMTKLYTEEFLPQH
jgi:NitT/TauT family transport system substrate-binding protein